MMMVKIYYFYNESEADHLVLVIVLMHQKVRSYLTELGKRGGIINTAIAISSAKGIIRKYDSNLLAENGGSIHLSKSWAKYLMGRMGLSKRRGDTKARVLIIDFEKIKAQYLFDIKVITEMDDIPPELIINWNQTGIEYVPVSSWTMAPRGSKRVEIIGKDDKCQITGVYGCSLSGDFLPVQLIYQGKTKKCLPSVTFPSDWNITFSENHWSNESTMIEYITQLLLPYIDRKKKELKIDS